MPEAPGLEMPFLDHLEELRHRLFWIAAAVVVGVVIAFILLSKLDIIRLLERPILRRARWAAHHLASRRAA